MVFFYDIGQEQDQNGPSSLAPSALSRHQDGAVTPMTDAEHLTPLPSLINGDMGMTDTIELPKVAPLGITPPVTPMPEVIQVCLEIDAHSSSSYFL